MKLKYGNFLIIFFFLLQINNVVAQTCTITAPSMNFGQISPISSSNVTVNGTFTINCNGFLGLGIAGVRACVNIGSGSASASFAPRFMASGSNLLQFNLFSNATYTTIWGTRTSATYPGVTVDVPIGALTGSGTSQVTMYGRIPGGQTTLPVGAYSSNFNSNSTEFNYQSYILSPPACTTITKPNNRFPFTVNAQVISDCTINSTNINFGTVSSLLQTLTANGEISVQCSNDNNYSIALNAGTGSGATVANRVLTRTGGTEKINYQLYSNASYTTLWGNGTLSTSVVNGMGTGGIQNFIVYGKVAPQTTPTAGSYIDTIIATITY